MLHNMARGADPSKAVSIGPRFKLDHYRPRTYLDGYGRQLRDWGADRPKGREAPLPAGRRNDHPQSALRACDAGLGCARLPTQS